ncbi:MAG: hypothetical protein IJP69_05950 [Synergistaceae bacterium]|nr:hypothetical protein [Synergistaceae bacterium]
MPHLIAIEYSEAQRRQLNDKIQEFDKKGWPLNAKYDAQNFGTWQKLFENAITPGLFSERELIVVENSETLGEFPETLANFIEDDKADCIIILIFNSDTKNLNFVKNSITIIKPEAQIPPWKRREWLINLSREKKFKLSNDAAQLLADTIESQEELRGEIEKLALYSEIKNNEIKINDIENLCFDEGGRALINFLDGICENNVIKVSRALKYLRKQPMLQILTGITNRLRPALIISTFGNKYLNDALKAVGVNLTKKYALEKSQSALKNFGAEKIKTFMMKSARLSYLEKTNNAEGWQGFEFIIWELMQKV